MNLILLDKFDIGSDVIYNYRPMPLFPDRINDGVDFSTKKGCTRRSVLKAVWAISGTSLLSACSVASQSHRESPGPVPVPAPRPQESPIAEVFIDGLKVIGAQLESWSLQDGKKVSDLYPEVREVKDLLIGKTDPRSYLPSLKLPLSLGIDEPSEAASLLVQPYMDLQDARRVQIRFINGAAAISYPWKIYTEVTLRLSTDVQKMNIGKLPFVVKEMSQFIRLLRVYKIYLDNTSASKAIFLNPSNTPTRTEDLLYNQGDATENAETEAWRYSALSELIDLGSGIGVGGLLYGTSLLNGQIGSDFLHQPGPVASQRYLDFLRDEKLVKEESGRMVWATPNPPIIGTRESITQTDKYIKRYFPGQSILTLGL